MADSAHSTGGTEWRELSKGWAEKAGKNIEKWDEQDVDTLLLATQEELGELTQAHLEAQAEDGDLERVFSELADLAALMYQIHWTLEWRSLQADTDYNTTEEHDQEDNANAEDSSTLNHTSTEDLQQAYDEADGVIAEAADRFGVTYHTVYQRMCDHGIHTTRSAEDDEESADDQKDDSDPTIEDDTTTSESEASDVDLEEADADDTPAGIGDDVQEASGAEEISVDGCDYDGEITIDLPDGITADDVDELTSGGVTISDLAEELGVHRDRARAIAHDLGYYSRVREVWRYADRGQTDPRAVGLLVVLLGLVLIDGVAVGVIAP